MRSLMCCKRHAELFFQGYDISIFYPAILHLFTATAPAATVADSKPLPRDFQVGTLYI